MDKEKIKEQIEAQQEARFEEYVKALELSPGALAQYRDVLSGVFRAGFLQGVDVGVDLSKVVFDKIVADAVAHDGAEKGRSIA